MKKLIIHETDPHGCGTVVYDGITYHYAYDDDEIGDVWQAVSFLIGIKFINMDQIVFIQGDEIYEYLRIDG